MSVWIRGPDLQIITLFLRLSLCYLLFFFAVGQLVKKTPNNKKGRLEAFFIFCLLFLQSYLVYYRSDSADTCNCVLFLCGHE